MIAIDPMARMTVFEYVDLKEFIAGLFDQPVDVVTLDGLKAHIRPSAMVDAIHAF